jgi:hypothetical protein
MDQPIGVRPGQRERVAVAGVRWPHRFNLVKRREFNACGLHLGKSPRRVDVFPDLDDYAVSDLDPDGV